MRIGKNNKAYAAGILALLIAVSGIHLSSAYAAKLIDTSKKCSLTLEVPFDSEYRMEENQPELTASLYKVAEVSETGTYSNIGQFGIDVTQLGKGDKSASWGEAAETAAAAIETAVGTESEITPDLTMKLVQGTATQTGLDQGMYLITMESVEGAEHVYTFSPYLIALPNNAYAQGQAAANDDWIYEVTSTLKLGAEPLYGSLVIEKTVNNFNKIKDISGDDETSEVLEGDATFVFQIEGMKGTKIYSDVISINFKEAGTQSVTIDQIPVGMDVTVTEVYAGANYQLVDENMASQKAVIVSDRVAQTKGIATVSFVNTYDGGMIDGDGVVNHFSYSEDDEAWNWDATPQDAVKK